ncbi:MAG: efflux RND transporter periplasmic adaptor subunit [Candidatus Cloacimonetes bacterium]|nr:efflux RND transporter periplasmic adaptor subunit [Candidatus Cloacimonadota bacterium]
MKNYMMIPLLLILSLSACGKKDKAAPEGKKPGNDDRQTVMVESLSRQIIDDFITVSGKLEGITDITMSSESSGRLLELYKKLGDNVNPGDRIGRLENEVARIRMDQAQAAFNSAQSALQNATKNRDYATTARERSLISEVEYLGALSAYDGAKAAFDGANAGLEQARLAYNNSYLLAPAKGRISYLNVAQGQYINQGMPIANITDAGTLILKSGVGDSQIAKIRDGLAADIEYQGKIYRGRIRGWGIKPMSASANYPIEIEVPGAKDLLPGMVVRAKIKTKTYPNLLATSLTNVAKEFDKNYLWIVQNSDDGKTQKAERHEVELGLIIGQYVEILSGADEGDLIVTSGSENLEDGSPVKIRQ